VHGWSIIDVELGNVCSSIGTVITKLSHHEFAEAFFVFVSEMQAKFNQGLVGHWLDAPGVACGGEHTGHFEHDEHQVTYGTISEWIISCNGDALDFTEAFPECLGRIFWGPHTGNAGAIGFQVTAGL